MKKVNKFLSVIIAATLVIPACTSDFEETNSNPDSTVSATNQMLVTQLLAFLRPPGEQQVADPWNFSKYTARNENGWSKSDIQYNGIGETGFGAYRELNNTLPLLKQSAGTPSEESCKGFSLWVKAYRLADLTTWTGDIPYSEALKAESDGIIAPKYDEQKEVFRQIIADLDAAYEAFGKATLPLDGDFTSLGGDLEKWKRIVNLTELRVLINLSKRADDTPDLNIKAKFAEVAARPLLRNRDDDMMLVFSDANDQMYALWAHDRGVSWPNTKILLTDYFENMLKKYDDRRLFYYFAPAAYKTTAVADGGEGLLATDPAAYVGVDPWMASNEISGLALENKISIIHNRYRQKKAESYTILGYTQQNFILAEAALRGWISGSAADYYKAGIRSGMEFTMAWSDVSGCRVDDVHPVDVQMDEAYITAHLDLPALQLTGSFDSDLNKILEQKYISAFMQFGGYEAYFDYRRTGFPVLPNDEEASMNILNRAEYPWRMKYPGGEASTNLDNYTEACNRQFTGSSSDDVSRRTWLVK